MFYAPGKSGIREGGGTKERGKKSNSNPPGKNKRYGGNQNIRVRKVGHVQPRWKLPRPLATKEVTGDQQNYMKSGKGKVKNNLVIRTEKTTYSENTRLGDYREARTIRGKKGKNKPRKSMHRKRPP